LIDKIAEAGSHAIEALKSSPLLLALVLFQFMLLGAVLWISHEQSQYEHQQFELLVKSCSTVGPTL
jgi:hypothetical protein